MNDDDKQVTEPTVAKVKAKRSPGELKRTVMTVGVTTAVLSIGIAAALVSGVVPGLSLPGRGEPSIAAPIVTQQPTAQQSTAAPSPDATTLPEDGEPVESSAPPASDGGSSDGGGEEGGAPQLPTASVTLTPESGVLYIGSIQNFSPQLETWVVDADEQGTGTVEYRRYNCLGEMKGVGLGSITRNDPVNAIVTWEGENPLEFSHISASETWVELSDTVLDGGQARANVHHDLELEKFGGMCKDAGETAANFIF